MGVLVECVYHLIPLILVVSAQESTVLDIGVIADGCPNEEVTNDTLTSTSVWKENVAVRLHWTYVDSSESYQLLRSVKDFRSRGMDSILLADDLKFVGGLPEELLTDDIPLLALGRVNTTPAPYADTINNCLPSFSAAIGTTTQAECLPPFRSLEYVRPSESNDTATYLGSNVISTLLHLRWTSVVVLYQQAIGFYMDRIIRTLSSHGLFIVTHEVDNLTSDELYHLMQTIDGSDLEANVNITVICHRTCTQSVLSTAGEYVRQNLRRSSMSLRSLWLVFQITDDNNLDWMLQHVSDYDNVAIVNLPTFFVGEGGGKIDILQLMRKALYSLGSNYTAATISRSEMNDMILGYLQAALQRCHWSPIETLMWTPEGRGWSNVGYVDVEGQTTIHAQIFPNTGFGFNGRTFMVSTLEWDPFVIALPNNTYTGLCFDLLDHLASSLNFTFEVGGPADGEWGVINSNGTWTGMVGQLAKWEIDIVAAPLSTQANREEVMDFTYSFYIDYTTILMKKPDPLKTKWRTLIDPFSEELLICVLISLPVVSLLLFLFERFSPYYIGEDERDDMSGLHTYQDAFWYMYGALLTQGGEHLPRSQTGRTLLSSWWLFCIIMMATYSGNLIAFLTVNKDKPLFTTVAEMIQLEEYRWGTIGGSSWITAFNETRASDLMKVWAGMLTFNATDPSVLSYKSSDHFAKVLEGGYSYIGDKTQMEITMATECSLLIADDEFMPLQYAFGLPNFSPYTKLFSDELLYVHESGLLHIWKTRRWPKRNFCDGKLMTEAKKITLVDVQSAFYLIGLGIGLATVVFFIEKASFYYLTKYRPQKDPADNEPKVTVTIHNSS